MIQVVGGIDLSTRGLGVCAIPVEWGLDWGALICKTFSHPLKRDASDKQRIERNNELAWRVVDFFRQFDVVGAWVESYALSQNTSAHTSAELGGVVKHELAVQLKLIVKTAQMASARTLFMGAGNLPRADAKEVLHTAVKSQTAVFSTGDEIDAFVAANWGLSELDLTCIASAPAVKQKRSRKKRKGPMQPAPFRVYPTQNSPNT